jgi:hypothetical protein
MKKTTSVLIVYLLLIYSAFAIGAKTSVADQAFAPPKVKALGRIECQYHNNPPDGVTIKFIKNNETLKTIELKGKICGEFTDPTCQYSVSPNYYETFIAITELHFKKNTPNEYLNRGLEYEQSHNIKYYNSKGDLLFEKDSSTYKPIQVENNGMVVCYQETPRELIMDVSEDFKGFPYDTKLFIFYPNGKLAYERKLLEHNGRINISNNSEWVLINGEFGRSATEKTLYIRVNMQNMKETEIEYAKLREYGSVRIGDDGWLILEKTKSKGSAIRYKYSPETGEINQIGLIEY